MRAVRRSSISKGKSYKEIGEFWDTHDLGDFWEKTKPAEFEVDIQSEIRYFRVDSKLSSKLVTIAKRRGVSSETLLNIWLQEKIKDQAEAVGS